MYSAPSSSVDSSSSFGPAELASGGAPFDVVLKQHEPADETGGAGSPTGAPATPGAVEGRAASASAAAATPAAADDLDWLLALETGGNETADTDDESTEDEPADASLADALGLILPLVPPATEQAAAKLALETMGAGKKSGSELAAAQEGDADDAVSAEDGSTKPAPVAGDENGRPGREFPGLPAAPKGAAAGLAHPTIGAPAAPGHAQAAAGAYSTAGDTTVSGVEAVAARFAELMAAENDATPAVVSELARKVTEVIHSQVVDPALRAIGIDPAKVTANMEIVAPKASTVLSDASADETATFSAGATRAIEQVLHTAELMRGADRTGVNLRLDFGESGPLSVHITLREGRVHTLFRSDSPELRETLTNAWNQFAQRPEFAAVLEEPVLLPLRQTNPTAERATGNSLSQHHHPDDRSGRQSGSPEETLPRFGERPSRRRGAATLPAAPIASERSNSSSRLSALA
ncbi:MAG TPA: hypothetical protein VHF69_10730 [Candidatus Synoicihabitans sp.]|nr:hypothetical protein [Candidatus Synoicihabitans sp.]